MCPGIITTASVDNAAGISQLCESPFQVPPSLSTSTVGCYGESTSHSFYINRSPRELFIFHPLYEQPSRHIQLAVPSPLHMLLCFSSLPTHLLLSDDAPHHHAPSLVRAPVTVVKELWLDRCSLCAMICWTIVSFTLSCINIYPSPIVLLPSNFFAMFFLFPYPSLHRPFY